MKRPIIGALFSLLAGIMLGQYGFSLSTVLFCVCLLSVVCACLFAKYRYWPVFLFILFALAGGWRIQNSLTDKLPRGTGTIELSGIIQDTGVTGSGNRKLIVKVNRCGANEIKGTRIIAYLKSGIEVEIGQEIILTGELLALENPRNPGDYNEFNYLRSRKIDAKIFPDTVETGAVHRSVRLVLNKLKNKLAEVYDYVLPEREASIIKSVILGEKIGSFDDVIAIYRLAGIYHILSISGLHVAIVMMMVNRMLRLMMNERLAGFVALAVMILYCLLTGSAVSTVRAVTMCGVAVFAKILFRDYDLPSSLAFASIVLLIYEPMYLYDAGFQLSFSAVAGMALLTTPIEHLLILTRVPLKPRIRNALAANIAAVAATGPILSYHFYNLSTYSILANMIILPTSAALVIFGIIVGVAGLLWLPLAEFLAGVVFYLLRFYDGVCRLLALLPFSVIQTGCCGLLVCLAAVGVMLVFAYTFSGFRDTLKKRLPMLIVSGLVLVALMTFRNYAFGMEAIVLHMDKGGCTVINNRGNTFAVMSGNADSETLISYLTWLGLSHIDGVFAYRMTDSDKANIQPLIAEGWVDALYTPEPDGFYMVLRSDFPINPAPIMPVSEGDTVESGDLAFHMVSDAVYITYGSASFAIYDERSRILQSTSADVLIWSLGYTSFNESSVPTSDIQALVVNGGRSRWNTGPFPTSLRDGGIPVYSTYGQGAVSIHTNGERIQIKQGDNH